jgi:hypothetical protein
MSARKFWPLAIIILIILAGCHFPDQPWVLVEITNLEEGQHLLLNEEVLINVKARSSQGIARVELRVNGELMATQLPPRGNPRDLIVEFPFAPLTEGSVIVSVLAVDRKGTISDPFSITLNVVGSIEDIEITSTPTPSAEELAQTQTAQAICSNSASFVTHVTIPENTQITTNVNFTKIWRVSNNGSCDWIGYQLVHSGGDQMGAISPKALPVVKAGSNADIVIEMTAPPQPGTHTSIWRIQAGNGTLFGPELITIINAVELPTHTPVPTNTPTPTPSPTQTYTPTLPAISVQQISVQISIPPNSTESKTINCPVGSIVVSGGFSHQSGIQVWQSKKDGNGWSITATNSDSTAKELTITATCLLNTKGTSSSVSEEKQALPNENTIITASCPSGPLVTGGGWSVENNVPVKVFISAKSGNAWQISVYNPTDISPKITAFAICLTGASGSTSQYDKKENKVPANSTASAQMNCPAGSYVTGGGFIIDQGLTLFQTAQSDNGWINFVSNPTDAEKRLDTFTICYQP